MLSLFLIPILIIAILFTPVIIAVKKKKGEKSIRNALMVNFCTFFDTAVIFYTALSYNIV